jgi:hypothetical protein
LETHRDGIALERPDIETLPVPIEMDTQGKAAGIRAFGPDGIDP